MPSHLAYPSLAIECYKSLLDTSGVGFGKQKGSPTQTLNSFSSRAVAEDVLARLKNQSVRAGGRVDSEEPKSDPFASSGIF